MEMRLLKNLVTHINCFVRQHISEDIPYVLTLDGHLSRNRYAWLDYCEKVKCEVIQLPSNTSHFLQPCDRNVNKQLENVVRSFRDKLSKLQCFSLNSVRTKLTLASVGYLSISALNITESFRQCGLWPMDYRFTFFSNDETINFKTTQKIGTTSKDSAIVYSLLKITDPKYSPSVISQQVTSFLADRVAVTRVFSQRECYGDNLRIHSRNDSREVLQRGTPAVCLKIGEIIENRKKKSLEKKTAARKKAVEKSRKETERRNKQALRTITGSSCRDKKLKTEAVQAL